MRCYKAKKLFSPYIDGDLSTDKKLELEVHIKQCEKCRTKLEQLIAIHESFNVIHHFKAPAGFATRVMAHIEERKLKKLSLSNVLIRVFETAVIILILIIGSHIGKIIETTIASSQPSIRTTLSLETFDAVQPNSIGGAYLAMLQGNNEK